MEPLQFKLDLLQYPALQKKMLIRSVSLMVILFTVLSVYTMRDANREDVIFWVTYVAIMIVIYTFSTRRGLKKRKANYESYSITINEQGITRVQDKWVDLFIPLSEITSIQKTTDGKFVIKGLSNDPLQKINVPAQIENYQKVEEVLAAIVPITTNVKTVWWEQYPFVLSLLIVIPLLGVYIVDNKIVVGVSAIISITGLLYCFFNIRKYQGSMKNLNRSLWFIPFVILSVLMIAYSKLTA